jgi:hypothetical protein
MIRKASGRNSSAFIAQVGRLLAGNRDPDATDLSRTAFHEGVL